MRVLTHAAFSAVRPLYVEPHGKQALRKVQDMIKEVSANGGETTDHPEFLASPARKMQETHGEEKLVEAHKVSGRGSSGHTDTDKLTNVLLYMKKRPNDEENDQLEVADVYALEYV